MKAEPRGRPTLSIRVLIALLSLLLAAATAPPALAAPGAAAATAANPWSPNLPSLPAISLDNVAGYPIVAMSPTAETPPTGVTVTASGGGVSVSARASLGSPASSTTTITDFSATLDLTSLPDGVVQFSATEAPPSGAPFTVTLGVTRKLVQAPVLAYAVPPAGSTIPLGTTDVDAVFTRRIGGRSATVTLPDNSTETLTGSSAYPDPGNPFTTTVAFNAEEVGTYTLAITEYPQNQLPFGNPGGAPSTTTLHYVVTAEPPGLPSELCGDVTSGTLTWTAGNGPHVICPAGVTLESPDALVIDASQGPVSVTAAGSGGLTSKGAALSVINTTASNTVSFDADPANQGGWAGLTLLGDNPEFAGLSYVTVAHARVGITSYTGAALDHVAVTNTSYLGIALCGGTLSDSTITSPGGQGVVQGQSCRATTVRDSTITGAVEYGVRGIDAVLSNVTVNGSGTSAPAHPAVELEDTTVATGVPSVSGSGNGIDAIALEGTMQSLTWTTPTNATTDHTLGYVNLGLTFPTGEAMTVPARASVWSDGGGLTLQDSAVLTAGSGTTFTATDDAPSYPALEGSVLAWGGGAMSGDWAGINDATDLTLVNATVSYAYGDYSNEAITAKDVVADGLTLTQSGYLETADLTLTDAVITCPDTGRECGVDAAGDVVISSVTLHGSALGQGNSGIVADAPDAAQPADIQNVTVTASSRAGLSVGGDDPTVRNVTVSGSGYAGYGGYLGAGYSPIDIHGTNLSVGPGRSIDGLVGYDNEDNSMLLSGTISGDLTWVSPVQSETAVPLGYVGGGLTVTDSTLSAAAGSTVDFEDLSLVGGTFTVTGPGTTIGQHATDDFGSVTATDDATGRPSVINVAKTAWTYTGNGPSLTSSSGRGSLALTDSTLSGFAARSSSPNVLSSTGAAVTLTRSTLGIGIAVSGASLTMNRASIAGHPENSYIVSPNILTAITLTGHAHLVGLDSSLGNNATDLVLDSTSTADFEYGFIQDKIQTQGSVDAEHDYWASQNGGPAVGQIDNPADVDASSPVLSSYPQASVAVTPTTTDADGSYEGSAGVMLTYQWPMDQSITPNAVVDFYSPTSNLYPSEAITGSWTSPTVWAGSYQLSHKQYPGSYIVTNRAVSLVEPIPGGSNEVTEVTDTLESPVSHPTFCTLPCPPAPTASASRTPVPIATHAPAATPEASVPPAGSTTPVAATVAKPRPLLSLAITRGKAGPHFTQVQARRSFTVTAKLTGAAAARCSLKLQEVIHGRWITLRGPAMARAKNGRCQWTLTIGSGTFRIEAIDGAVHSRTLLLHAVLPTARRQ